MPHYILSNYRDLLKTHGIKTATDAQISAAIHRVGVLSTPEETDSAVVETLIQQIVSA